MIKYVFPLCCLVLSSLIAAAQEFTTTEGSIYGGVANTSEQPASGVYMPYRWDIMVAGVNSFWNNNILATSPAKWRWEGDSLNLGHPFITGGGKRWLSLQADVHVLNFLFRWPGRNDLVVGAGWNLHSISAASRLNYYYDDSLKFIGDFLEANAFNRVQQGTVLNQQWSEWYITASKVLRDNRLDQWTVGGTLKLVKGMSAVVIDLDGVSVDARKTPQGPTAVFNYASGRYGYSQNLEELSNNEDSKGTLRTLFNGSPITPSLSVGVSYLARKMETIAGFTNEDPADYNWKLEASITDIGRLKYPLGQESMVIRGLKGQPEVDRFVRILDSASTLNRFNDSLQNLADITPWNKGLSVSLPTALRINVDKNLGSHFFINSRMVLDLSFLNVGVDYRSRLISYVMVTPRWEIKRIAFYAPVYVNSRGSLMAGAAVRLGPLLAGVHDFGWIVHNSRTGGAYLALVIRGLLKDKSDCPTF